MHTTKEVLWLLKLLCQILSDLVHLPTTIYCDNQAAIKLITTDNYHSCTKHLDQHYQFVWEVASKGVIKPLYCPSEDMVADVLTKALPKWKVAAHANTLGMCRACRGVVYKSSDMAFGMLMASQSHKTVCCVVYYQAHCLTDLNVFCVICILSMYYTYLCNTKGLYVEPLSM